MMKCLNDKENFVLMKFFNLDGEGEQTLQTIANQMNMSGERIRQVKDKAIHKLKGNKSNKKLVQYL